MENLFDSERWARVGATDEEIVLLRDEHAEMSVADQQGQSAWLDGVSDADLRSYLDARREAGFESTDEVEDDDEKPTKARHATPKTQTTGEEPSKGADSSSTS